jgi:hypothetical protein
MAYIWLSALASMIVVPQIPIARLIRRRRRPAAALRLYSQMLSPVRASTAWMKSPPLG